MCLCSFVLFLWSFHFPPTGEYLSCHPQHSTQTSLHKVIINFFVRESNGHSLVLSHATSQQHLIRLAISFFLKHYLQLVFMAQHYPGFPFAYLLAIPSHLEGFSSSVYSLTFNTECPALASFRSACKGNDWFVSIWDPEWVQDWVWPLQLRTDGDLAWRKVSPLASSFWELPHFKELEDKKSFLG